MRLIVKSIRESPFLIGVDPSMAISGIKHRIYALLGIPPEFQRIILRGHILSNSLTIAALRLPDMGTIYFYGRCTRKSPPRPSHFSHRPLRSPPLSRAITSDAFLRLVSPQSLYFAQVLRCIDDDESMAGFDPVQRLERWKGLDRAMNTIESRADGARILAANYAAVMQLFEELKGKPASEGATVIAAPPDRPCTAPLPMPLDRSAGRMRAAFETFSLTNGRVSNLLEDSKSSRSSLLELFLEILSSDDEKDETAIENRFDLHEGEEQRVYPQVFHPKPKRPRHNHDLSDFDIN
jgi:hypothetical protein